MPLIRVESETPQEATARIRKDIKELKCRRGQLRENVASLRICREVLALTAKIDKLNSRVGPITGVALSRDYLVIGNMMRVRIPGFLVR